MKIIKISDKLFYLKKGATRRQHFRYTFHEKSIHKHSTWSWPSGCCIGLRSWLRGFDAQLGHLYDACTSLPQKSQAAIKWLEIRKKKKIHKHSAFRSNLFTDDTRYRSVVGNHRVAVRLKFVTGPYKFSD